MIEPNIILERMTRPEVEAALLSGFKTVVVPCGAVEQHGPHLPLFVDAEIGTRLGEEVARRLGNALVAPTIRIGCSTHHMNFAGTLTLRESTFQAVCHDYCTSLASHGFTHICLMPTHGGNFNPIADAVNEFNEAVGPDCKVSAFTDLIAIVKVWKSIIDTVSGLGSRVGGHADIAESSVMLSLHPDLVQRELAEAGFQADLSPELVEQIVRDGIDSVAPNGILGDARGMSEEMGVQCLSATADMLAEHFSASR